MLFYTQCLKYRSIEHTKQYVLLLKWCNQMKITLPSWWNYNPSKISTSSFLKASKFYTIMSSTRWGVLQFIRLSWCKHAIRNRSKRMRPFISSHFWWEVSMAKKIETLLGLRKLTQYATNSSLYILLQFTSVQTWLYHGSLINTQIIIMKLATKTRKHNSMPSLIYSSHRWFSMLSCFWITLNLGLVRAKVCYILFVQFNYGDNTLYIVWM